ncbi:MAG: cardiolipin synthase B [Nitrospirae bacterium GWC2_56_14]|nr:MAG: cardiolipin synthase B [Nitrospirae bacterium GWC2_56_14]
MSRGKRYHEKLYQAVLPAKTSRFIPGNQVTLLQNGEEYFPALEAAFDRATHAIYLQTYIYEQDATGRRIADALKRAVLRGVSAYVLIDGYGSKDLPHGMLDRLRADGVKVIIFRAKISPWTCRRERLRRMHRKVAVVDREIAFVGGINIIDDREVTGAMPPRYDYAVAVEGPLVDEIHLSVQRLWSRMAWSYFRKGPVRDRTLPVSSFAGGSMSAAFLVRDNIRHRRDIEWAYLRAIEQAGSEIILAHAYFLPGLDFRHALINAAGRGVRVVLLLQGRMEFFLQHYATRALYGTFLDAGIELYEYRKSFLHAKVAVIDGHWATVGSSNIDPFSLLLSREANVAVDDGEFGAALAHSLKRTMEIDGLRILRDSWKQQPAYLRVLSWLSYGLLRAIVGISGYARDPGQARKAPGKSV